MMEFSEDDSGSSGTLTLTGPLTIQHAQPLKEIFLKAIGAVEKLVVNLEQVEEMDLTALQLFCAAHRNLMESGKTLAVEGTIPESVHKAVWESGFTACAGKDDNSTIWMGATN